MDHNVEYVVAAFTIVTVVLGSYGASVVLRLRRAGRHLRDDH